LAQKNFGKEFEKDIQQSCLDSGVFFYRIKDVFVPIELRQRIKVPPNKYDCFIYHDLLLAIEMKSTAQKSFSMDEKIIKSHQISNLIEAAQYPNVVGGFLFNFREYENKTYFVPIEEFVDYKNTIEGKETRIYKSKLLKSAISLNICEEIGIKVLAEKKRVHWRYDIVDLVQKIKEQLCKNS
jgi:penicillin-binding protein-related factor A (putative recombinase)